VNRRQRKKVQSRLMSAIIGDDRRRVAALLRAGADPNLPDSYGTTPLYLASVQGAATVVPLLLAAGAEPNVETGQRTEGTPLCAAACWGHAAVVRELLAYGADPNLREDQGAGMTPLEWAVRGSHDETAELLRAAGGAVSEA